MFVSKALAKQSIPNIFLHYHHHGMLVSRFEISRLSDDLCRRVMKKRRSPCSIASAKPKRQSWASALAETNVPRWPAHVKACVNANAGEAKSSARSAERCPRSRTVRPLSFTRVHPAEHDVAGLTDYEVRDVNDDINKLLREKRHWENQIIALGGANYRRNVAMLDDDGKEVPGTKGYKSVSSPSLPSPSHFSHLELGTLVAPKNSPASANSLKVERRRKRKKTKPWPITKSLCTKDQPTLAIWTRRSRGTS